MIDPRHKNPIWQPSPPPQTSTANRVPPEHEHNSGKSDFEHVFSSLDEAKDKDANTAEVSETCAEEGIYNESTADALDPTEKKGDIHKEFPISTFKNTNQTSPDLVSTALKNLSEQSNDQDEEKIIIEGVMAQPTIINIEITNAQAAPAETTDIATQIANTKALIEKIYDLTKKLLKKAEVCVDKEGKSFSITILEDFLSGTEIDVSHTDTVTVILKPVNANQYQFLQTEKESLRKTIKTHDETDSITFVILEPPSTC